MMKHISEYLDKSITTPEVRELQEQLDELYASLPELPENVLGIIASIVDTEIELEKLSNV